VYDTEQLAQVFITVSPRARLIRDSHPLVDRSTNSQAFSNLPLTPLQTIMFDYRGIIMKATVRSISTLDGSDGDNMGIIMEGTEINWFKDPSSAIKLKNTSNR
jgi:hypothetical protein